MSTKQEILFVENDRATLRIYQKMVDKLTCWNGHFFTNYDDALQNMVNHQYCLIISNTLTASSFNGDEFFKLASMIQPNALRILISSSKLQDDHYVIHMFIEKQKFSARKLGKLILSYTKQKTAITMRS